MDAPRRRTLPAPNFDPITLLDRPELCQQLGISLWTLSIWIKQGKLPKPIVLSDSSHRWRASDIAAWLDKLAKTPHLPPKLRGKAAMWGQPKRKRVRTRLSPDDLKWLQEARP